MSGRLFLSGEDLSDDEEFAVEPEAGSSRLSSLFGPAATAGEVAGDNSALVYKAPKQPTVQESSRGTKVKPSGADNVSGSPTVIYATAVHAFVLQNNEYQKVGKVGLAILGNQGAKEWSLLLYVTKQRPVVQLKILHDFSYSITSNNYVQFVDSRNQEWSIAFEREKDLVDFAKWLLAVIGTVKASDETPAEDSGIIIKDLCLGDGDPLAVSDSVELDYTEYLVENGPLVSEFSSNIESTAPALRVKIGKEMVPKGWENGIVGMRRNGKRLFYLPTQLGQSLTQSSTIINTSSPLIVYAHAKKVKFAKRETDDKRTDVEPSSDVTQAADSKEKVYASTDGQPSGLEEQTSAENPISDATNDEDKSTIVSRMAKIGQPMFPLAPAVTANTGPTPLSRQVSETTAEKQPKPAPRAKPHPPESKPDITEVSAAVTAENSMPASSCTPATANISSPLSSPRSMGGLPPTVNLASLPFYANPLMNLYPYPLPSDYAIHGLPPSSYPLCPQYPIPYPFLPSSAFGQSAKSPAAAGTGEAQADTVTGGQKRRSSTGSGDGILSINSKQLLDEVERRHLTLQDALTKLLTNHIGPLNNKVDAIEGKLEAALAGDRNNNSDVSDVIQSTSVGEAQISPITVDKRLDKIEAMIDDKLEHSLANFSALPSQMESCCSKMDEMGRALESIVSASNERSANSATDVVQLNSEGFDDIRAQLALVHQQNEQIAQRLLELEAVTAKERIMMDGGGKIRTDGQMAKKIMNAFYKQLCGHFASDATYSGEDIQEFASERIKAITTEYLGRLDSSTVQKGTTTTNPASMMVPVSVSSNTSAAQSFRADIKSHELTTMPDIQPHPDSSHIPEVTKPASDNLNEGSACNDGATNAQTEDTTESEVKSSEEISETEPPSSKTDEVQLDRDDASADGEDKTTDSSLLSSNEPTKPHRTVLDTEPPPLPLPGTESPAHHTSRPSWM